MALNFIEKAFSINNNNSIPTIQFYRSGFRINGKEIPSWQDIVLSGNGSLSLTAALANGLNYLKLFGGTEQRNIPNGYTQVEYLEGTGTQYIDTGYIANGGMAIEAKAAPGGTRGSYTFWIGSIGVSKENPDDTRNAVGANGNALSWQKGKVYSGAGFNLTNNNPVVVYMNTIGNTFEGKADGTTINVNPSSTQQTLTGLTTTVKIGYSDYSSAARAMTIYYLKMWNNNYELIQNLIPCRRNSDNVLGMYDTVSGTFFTNQGTGTFTAGADVTTPSPDTPIDIVCNNGVVKARHQSGLPLGYTLLDYIESTGTQYIDTGYKPNSNTAISIKYYPAVSPAFMCLYGTQESNALNRFYGLISSTRFRLQVNSNAAQTPNFWGFNKDGTSVEGSNGTFAETQCIVDLTVDNINKKVSIKSDEYTGDFSLSGTVFGDNLDCTYNMLLLSRSTAGTVGNNFSGRIYGFSIKDNDNLVQNLIPARRKSDNVLGMFDLVSNTFLTNAGTGTFTAGSEVSDPIEIYTDGTVETVEVIGKNLYNPATRTDGYYIGADGVIAQGSGTFCYSALIPVKPNTNYMLSGIAGQSDNRRLHAYDSNGNWISQISFANTTAGNTYNIIGTTPNNCVYVRISIPMLDTNVQLEQGSTATTYEPYFNGGSATAENLLSVDNFTDVQSILDGIVTKKVGVHVLDGTENWTRGVAIYADIPAQNVYLGYKTCLCTHYNGVNNTQQGSALVGTYSVCIGSNANGTEYKNRMYFYPAAADFTTATEWSDWLKAQYNAGTPVIIVYPLAEPTTETVTAQPLTTQAGTNIVEITQASIDNLGLEVSYKGKI